MERVQKWEHWVDMVYSNNPEELYTRGEEGWQLVTVITFDSNWRFYWKRPLTEEVKPE